jgi:hypothetical protein
MLGTHHLRHSVHTSAIDSSHCVGRPYRASLTCSGITLPPLLFISYLGLDEGVSNFTLAWTRFVDILIGIAAAVVVGTTIWPNHARVRYLLAVSSTMERATDYCRWSVHLHMFTPADD